jgi:hypothetical protein
LSFFFGGGGKRFSNRREGIEGSSSLLREKRVFTVFVLGMDENENLVTGLGGKRSLKRQAGDRAACLKFVRQGRSSSGVHGAGFSIR